MDHKRAVQARILSAAVAVIVLVVALLLLLRHRNRRLCILNETLYRNNRLLMEKEESTRRELEENVRLRELRAKSSETTAKEKYSHSDLTDADKEDIYLSIMDVLLHSQEVFTPDFSAKRLSELTGYTYRHISQVINEKTGDNFNALVNDIRIKEACQHLQPGGKYARLTVEAVANAVGFRSRTSFIGAFKKFTGMTPSAYIKTAENDTKAKHP